MNTKHKVYFLFILFISGLFMVPILGESTSFTSERILVNENIESGIMPREIRIAIYDEPNKTAPAYATNPGGINNNVTDLAALLDTAGYSVDLLGVQDISNYQLKTADYDVFIMCDNYPRENITDRVVDFWSGGGGILAFDGSSGFLCYFGILPPEAVGTSGSGAYWSYGGDDIIITSRHPVTKSYHGGTIEIAGSNLVWNYPSLLATSIGVDITKLATSNIDSDHASVLAFEPSARGGKIVTMAHDLAYDEIGALGDMIVDAVDWLAPQPKGRILYDLTHNPIYGIDTWDSSFVQSAITQIDMRGMLVNRSYTFDKLYPSNTLSSENLAGYDILVVNDPNTNFTASEVAAVTNWVNAGGSILAIADHVLSNNQNMNYLLSNMDIAINHSATGTNTLLPSDVHVTHEGSSSVLCLAPGAVGTAGSAFSIWEDAAGVPVIGGDRYGNGRIILIADGAIVRDGRIGVADNAQALINFANWLSAANADILVYVDHGGDIRDPNRNPYMGPVALALNDLGVSFYLTSDGHYFNQSLFYQEWDMVIFDNINTNTAIYQPHLMDFVADGGKLIMNTWSINGGIMDYFGIDSIDYLDTSPWTLYLWNEAHPVFSLPVDYGADNVSSTLDVFGGLGTYAFNFTTFDNATAIAGFSPTVGNGAGIILSAEGRAIMNGPLLSLYGEDTDDSTYMDAYELWINEIAFMLRPSVNHPLDVEYTEGETGNNIVWAGYGGLPFAYSIESNSTPVHGDDWDGGAVSYNVDGLTNGTYIFEITLVDDLGRSVSDSVTVTVLPYVAPTNTTTTTTDGGGDGAPLDPTLILILAGAAGVVIVIIIIIVMKKK